MRDHLGRLMLRYSLLSFLCVLLLVLSLSILTSRLLTKSLLERDANLMSGLVQSTLGEFPIHEDFTDPRQIAVLKKLYEMPEVVRVKVWSPDYTILWSDETKLIGRRFAADPDIKRALAGQLVSQVSDLKKKEHLYEREKYDYLLEIYIPVKRHENVVAVVEFYKFPRAFFQDLHQSKIIIWSLMTAAGLVLYGLIFWIGRRTAQSQEKLFRELWDLNAELSTLLETSKTLNSTLDIKEILARIIVAISSHLAPKAISVMLVDEENQQLRAYDGYNLSPEYMQLAQEIRQTVSRSPSLEAIQTKKPVAIDDIHQDERFEPWREAAIKEGYTSFVSIPLILQDRAIGVINIYSEKLHHFSPEDVRLLTMFANQAVTAIENARLYREKTQVYAELREANLRLEELAVTDDLTQVYNRRFLQERLFVEVARSMRYQIPLSCLMIDIDHFKFVNDNYGHQRGDEVLKDLSLILRESTRKVDLVARYGGEEFIILLPHTPQDGALRKAQALRQEIALHKFAFNGDFLHITVSIGVATFPHPGIESVAELIAVADKALYRAKEKGRNRVETVY
jgi:diguanylate cyclase (GGDEF)-like protein